MLLKLTVEEFVLCAVFIAMIFTFVAKDRKGGLQWYPKTIQQEAVLRRLVSNQYIEKQAKKKGV
ncbi:MAG: hypothetical protein Q4B57_05805 [Eubacteriales bacterium]|nr:hypothetical protein [Eubacteriales bacterium]